MWFVCTSVVESAVVGVHLKCKVCYYIIRDSQAAKQCVRTRLFGHRARHDKTSLVACRCETHTPGVSTTNRAVGVCAPQSADGTGAKKGGKTAFRLVTP